jgi:hypothetical protein
VLEEQEFRPREAAELLPGPRIGIRNYLWYGVYQRQQFQFNLQSHIFILHSTAILSVFSNNVLIPQVYLEYRH